MVYLVAGLSFAALILLRMLLIFYGVPLHPLLFVGLLGAFVVAAGGLVSLAEPSRGRLIAACGLAGLLTNWFPWLVSVVPEHNIIPSQFAYATIVAYLVVVAFAALYPARSLAGNFALLAICVAGALTFTTTYRQRVRMGEYDRPSIACFRWDPVPPDTLVIARDPLGCIDDHARATLLSANLHGSLYWCGGSTLETSQRVLVFAQARPPEHSQVFYPRHGLVVYAFDGHDWSKIPRDAETYSLYSTLQPSGADTMICSDEFSGSRTCTGCFQWQ